MPLILSKEILENILSGQILSATELDSLLVASADEGLYLEYKDGAVLNASKKDANQMLRRYATGFANSEGGLLIIGVTETRPRAVMGCSAPGGGSLSEWASRSLTPLVPFLSPVPRIQTILHGAVEVLVVATDRSPSLVPCSESGDLIYYIRLGDQTLPCPEYLISDLVLGRRQHPNLSLSVDKVQFGSATSNVVPVKLSFTIENVGLRKATSLKLGIVFLTCDQNETHVPSALRHYLEVESVVNNEQGLRLCHYATQHGLFRPSLDPFERRASLELNGPWLPFFPTESEASIAAYLLSEDSPPMWFQLRYRFSEAHRRLSERERITGISIERAAGTRPRVAWSGPT